jgi:hypothetical protein
MGTRADFYVGRDQDAEWIGSIAWDGYREGIPEAVLKAESEEAFRAAVANFASERDDWTSPDQGWPWPWNDSGTTDCSYWFFGDHVSDDHGGVYCSCATPMPEDDAEYEALKSAGERIRFPDMSARKNVTLGRRSGVILLGS